jgi:UDP-3-O-[3-hydroxymyristoyl] glucosamine N-acyltransferase
MNTDLIIFGTGAHARKAYQVAIRGGLRVKAFADENSHAQSPVAGVPVLVAAELQLLTSPLSVFVAIGNASVRQRLMDQYTAFGWALPALVHPHASVAPDALLGAGVLIAAGAVVESASRIGRGAIVDIGVLVDHDCHVAEFSHLRPGQVCLAGSAWPAPA